MKNIYIINCWYTNDPTRRGAPCFYQTNFFLAVEAGTENLAIQKAKKFTFTRIFKKRFPWIDRQDIFIIHGLRLGETAVTNLGPLVK